MKLDVHPHRSERHDIHATVRGGNRVIEVTQRAPNARSLRLSFAEALALADALVDLVESALQRITPATP